MPAAATQQPASSSRALRRGPQASTALQIRTVQPPHPEWTPGTPQPIPYPGSYITLDPAELGGSACYPLVISAVVPRPIGFLGTQSAKGAVNLSPYSYFGAMGHDPPLVSSSLLFDFVQ